jgi:hypothetical protein
MIRYHPGGSYPGPQTGRKPPPPSQVFSPPARIVSWLLRLASRQLLSPAVDSRQVAQSLA